MMKAAELPKAALEFMGNVRVLAELPKDAEVGHCYRIDSTGAWMLFTAEGWHEFAVDPTGVPSGGVDKDGNWDCDMTPEPKVSEPSAFLQALDEIPEA